MSEKTLDRRVRRTRQAYRDALVELLTEKPYDALTVTEITKCAGLRRATFYLHYDTKEDLLASVLHAQLKAPDDANADNEYLALFRQVSEQAVLYRSVLRGGGEMVLRRELSVRLEAVVRQDAHAPDLADVVTLAYAVGGGVSVLLWWLERDSAQSVDEIALAVRQLVAGNTGQNS